MGADRFCLPLLPSSPAKQGQLLMLAAVDWVERFWEPKLCMFYSSMSAIPSAQANLSSVISQI